MDLFRRPGGRAAAAAIVVAGTLVAAALGAAGCSEPERERSPATLAVEARAGDFLDYYEEILLLSRRYAASPDSFRTAVDALPGSHLTDEEWLAWTAPYEEDAGPLAERLEEVIAELSKPLEIRGDEAGRAPVP